MKTDRMRPIWGNLSRKRSKKKDKDNKIKNDEERTGTGTSCNWGSVADC